MRFFINSSDANYNPLINALSDYMDAIDRGDYDPQLESVTWTIANEVTCIQHLLQNLPEELKIENDINLTLYPKLKSESVNNLPYIAHLLASLTILKNQQIIVESSEELEKLKELGILVHVKAAMPGPCLAYLGALRCSSLSNTVKLTLINNVIINLHNDMDKFGVLSHIALRVALEDWHNITTSLDRNIQNKLIEQIERYDNLKYNCLTEDVVRQNLTFIDQCIMSSWEKLNHGMGLYSDSNDNGSVKNIK